MRAVQEWRRKDLLALTAFLLFFFLYANIHALHSDGAKSLEDVVFRKDQARQPAGTGRLNDPDIDPFDPANPANETLGVSFEIVGNIRPCGCLTDQICSLEPL